MGSSSDFKMPNGMIRYNYHGGGKFAVGIVSMQFNITNCFHKFHHCLLNVFHLGKCNTTT